MAVPEFLGSTVGRAVRIVLGLALIAVGVDGGGVWLLVAAVGVVPLLAGVLDVCFVGPVAGLPFKGEPFRARCGVR